MDWSVYHGQLTQSCSVLHEVNTVSSLISPAVLMMMKVFCAIHMYSNIQPALLLQAASLLPDTCRVIHISATIFTHW